MAAKIHNISIKKKKKKHNQFSLGASRIVLVVN